ncbi:MAG: RagB/SusD family nutrient uptake outer membrane protein [Chryseolinea sp.]
MKKIYILFIITLLISSCNVLDQGSPNDVTEDDVFTSEDGANSALIGLYNTLQSRDYYGGYYPMMADVYSDVGTAGGFDNVSLQELSDLNVTSANIFIQQTWISIYNTINAANAIINNVDGIDDAGFTDEERGHIKGQALALRALAHFDVLRMFGEHWDQASEFGIPVVLTKQAANDIVARSTVAETYAAILDDLEEATSLIIESDRSQFFVNPIAVKALEARVNLYKGDLVAASAAATEVIDDGAFSLLDENTFTEIYTAYPASESIFELTFDVQNRSAYNSITFSRQDALRTEVLWLAEEGLNDFFASRSGDLRADLVDFVNNDGSILPDGRTQKYRGEEARNNPALILRMAEMYLIRAEAKGRVAGLSDLNEVRINRGLAALTAGAVPDDASYLDALLDERKAELNFEGHRMFDLARAGKINEVLGIDDDLGIFPIPFREITATNGALTQNPGYE